MAQEKWWSTIDTKEGVFIASYSGSGLCELRFPRKAAAGVNQQEEPLPREVGGWHRMTCAAVKAILDGKKPEELPPLDVSRGSEFQRAVWRVLRGIKRGEAMSYGEVAQAMGRPGASRAVGSACGANPIPLLIPCHRVLAGGRKLGGFSGGLNWKVLLLEREGCEFQFSRRAEGQYRAGADGA